MAEDKREMILQRLLAIAGTVPQIVHAQRNEIGLRRELQPGMVLLDGDEEIVTSQRIKGPVVAPQIMRMRFGLYVQVKDKKPVNEGVGTLLNAIRLDAIRLVAGDLGLRTLIGTNGKIEYLGVITDLKAGAALGGEMNLGFAISYLFNPTA